MISAKARNFLFPPPGFLLMPAVGIDISDRSIKYVELLHTEHGRKLGRYGDKAVPAGIIEGGKIINQNKLIEELSELRKEQNLTFVRAALPEEQVYFFRMSIPDTGKNLRDTLELSLEEHVPILAADTIFDYEIISRKEGTVEVGITAASREVIESYSETFFKAGLVLLSLELEAEAIARATIHEEDETAHLIVDFGETRTGIAVSSGGHIRFTSTVSIGGQMLTETLAKHFNIPIEKAEAMKREFGLSRNTPHQDLFALLLNNIAVLRDEINKHFIYWHTHPDESGKPRPPIGEIVLVGGDSNLVGLCDYLSTSLRVKTTLADVWKNVSLPEKTIPDLGRSESLGYATSIGLALHDATYE